MSWKILEGDCRAEMAGMVLGADTGEWIGPYESARGYHWLRIREQTESTPLPLEVVREPVRLDWIGEEEQARLDERVAELRNRYSIVFTGFGSEP